jgi:hypothetical protein
MEKIEAMVLVKHGIKRNGPQAVAAQPNGAPVEEKTKKAAAVSKPAN